jgi:hypothetical protein
VVHVNYIILKLTIFHLEDRSRDEEKFMDNYSNWIFSSADDVGLEWYDEDEQPNEKIDYNRSKYAGKCKLTF